jgi:hypothetical protein
MNASLVCSPVQLWNLVLSYRGYEEGASGVVRRGRKYEFSAAEIVTASPLLISDERPHKEFERRRFVLHDLSVSVDVDAVESLHFEQGKDWSRHC